MTLQKSHPSQRFIAPSSIQHGVPLKELMDRKLVTLLEMLKDDPELYVRRSVANHLGDIAQHHLEVALNVCEAWLEEMKRCDNEAVTDHRRWIVRHAVRHPAK